MEATDGPVKVRRHHRWGIGDSVLMVIALVELAFLPVALKAFLTPFICHTLRLSTPPVGATFLILLTGTIASILLFIFLCFLVRRHAYPLILLALSVLLLLELGSYPLATLISRLNGTPAPSQPGESRQLTGG